MFLTAVKSKYSMDNDLLTADEINLELKLSSKYYDSVAVRK